MGLFRKAAYVASGGVVAPHSRKQRTALKTLAAVQGASPEQVRKTGGRHDFDSAVTGTPRVTSPRTGAGSATNDQFLRLLAAWKADTEKDGLETIGQWSKRHGYGDLGELMP